MCHEILYLILLPQSEKGGTAVTSVIKKSGAENRLMEFFPCSNQQQTEENFAKSFHAKDLPEVVAFRKQVNLYLIPGLSQNYYIYLKTMRSSAHIRMTLVQ